MIIPTRRKSLKGSRGVISLGVVRSDACEMTLAASAEAGGKQHTEDVTTSARMGWKLDTVKGTTPEMIDWKPGGGEGTTSAGVG